MKSGWGQEDPVVEDDAAGDRQVVGNAGDGSRNHRVALGEDMLVQPDVFCAQQIQGFSGGGSGERNDRKRA